MAGLHVHASNRTEYLVKDLSELIKQSGDPFASDIVSVQSRGMERYILLSLAEINGIAANIQFPFLSKVLSSIFEMYEISGGSGFPYHLTTLESGIFQLLLNKIDGDEFERLRYFLETKNSEISQLKAYQLSVNIAALFDRYAVQRPELLKKWNVNQNLYDDSDEIWQKNIYLEMLRKKVISVSEDRISELKEKIKINPQILPPVIHIFGVSWIPDLYRDLFEYFSLYSDIHYYYLTAVSVKDQYKGDAVLPNCFRAGLEFHTYFRNLSDQNKCILHENMKEIIHTDKLSYLKKGFWGQNTDLTFSSDDDSVIIQSCHSPLREVEILYDYLLKYLSLNDEFKAADIIVMVKDIDLYSPFIESVFDKKTDGIKLPYSISDRLPTDSNDLFLLLSDFLDLCSGKFTSEEILAFCENREVMIRFLFESEDEKKFKKWILDSGFIWGYDADFKKGFDLPATVENTWTAGKNNLFAGFTVGDDLLENFQSSYPVSSVAVEDFEIFGRFVHLLETLEFFRKKTNSKVSLLDWGEILGEVIEELSVRKVFEFSEIHSFLEDLKTQNIPDVFVSAEVVKEIISNQYEQFRYSHKFMNGGITFSSLVPMRSVPFRITCILGLNEDSFPSSQKNYGFDLMSKFKNDKDRDRKMDDRQLFNETLLCTESVLYLSYVGKDRLNNAERRPSSVVTEILDAFNNFTRAAMKFSPVQHHLHPFHPDYFCGSEYFSYSKTNYRRAESLIRHSQVRADFIPDKFQSSIKSLGEESLGLNEMIGFFRLPCRYFLKKYRIYQTKNEIVIPENEIFYPDGLEMHACRQFMLDSVLRTGRLNKIELKNNLKNLGFLAHEKAGEYIFDRIYESFETLLIKAFEIAKAAHIKEIQYNFTFQDVSVLGEEVYNVFENSLNYFIPGKIKAHKRIEMWIRYLCFLISEKNSENSTVTLHGYEDHSYVKEEYRLNSFQASNEIENLLKIYVEGRAHALEFYPETSFYYVKNNLNNSVFTKNNKLNSEIKGAWFGNPNLGIKGEKDFEAVSICKNNIENFLTEEFTLLSKKIFEPLINSMVNIN